MVTLEVTDGGGLTGTDTAWVMAGDYDGKFDYEGRAYKFKKIGTQIWMVKNLAFLPSVSPPDVGSETSGNYYVYEYRGYDTGEAKATENYRTDGVLYNWEAAKTACPPGWRLPSDADWKVLETYLGMSPADLGQTGMRLSGEVGRKLKSKSGWAQNGNGDNSSGFNLLPGGACDHEGGFYARNLLAFAWSSTVSKSEPSAALSRSVETGLKGVARNSGSVANAYPVRCILGGVENTKPTASFTVSQNAGFTNTVFEFDASASSDAETQPNQLQVRWDFVNTGNWTGYTTTKTVSHLFAMEGTYSVILEVQDEGGLTDTEIRQIVVSEWTGSDCVDPDGRSYRTVPIGNQLWMAENLAYLPTLSYDPRNPREKKRFYVSGYTGIDVAIAKQHANYLAYGVLYNWYAAMNDAAGSYSVPSGVQGICPDGWHLRGLVPVPLLLERWGRPDSWQLEQYRGGVFRKMRT